MKEIYLFKMSNGEIVLSKAEELDDDFLMEQPMSIVPAGEKIALIPFLIGTKNNVELKVSKNHIVTYAKEKEIDEHLYSDYIKTVSGIVISTPQEKSKILNLQ